MPDGHRMSAAARLRELNEDIHTEVTLCAQKGNAPRHVIARRIG